MRPQVWAPQRHRVRVATAGGEFELTPDAERPGWWVGDQDLPVGTRYGFLLDDADDPRPDPRGLRLPEGVHGLSEVYDPAAHEWTDQDWAGRGLPGAVLYELHVGTFTLGATLDSAIERLDHLVGLGITHVELLPLNSVNGTWNWGYDGVAWYAVHEPYGGPDALMRFVQACHQRGLAVLLDVVYNHLGPSGNYLPEFGPYLKTGRNTWGDLVNLDEAGSDQVRRFIIDNALMWLRDFHVDGLRLDAVHALHDTSETHLLTQLGAEVAALSEQLGRPLPLIAESDLNDPVMITPRNTDDSAADDSAAGDSAPAETQQPGYGLDAQWDDDVHHVLHVLLSGEKHGYYADFGSLASLEKVATGAFFHDGSYSSFRGRPHGKPVDRHRTPGWRFVVCLQNHDQVGNRAVGDRLPEISSPQLLRVGAVLLLSLPFTPMLWMGEEWAAGTRWPFFTSHPQPELGKAVSEGRIAEFAEHGWDPEAMTDPQDPEAYRQAVLDWTEPERNGHREMLELYRQLIRLRAAEPELADPRLDLVVVHYDEDARWAVLERGGLRVVLNLADEPRDIELFGPASGGPASGGPESGAAEVLLATGAAELAGRSVELAGESAAIVRLGSSERAG